MSTDSSQSVDAEYVQATKQQVRDMVTEIAQLSKSDVAPTEFYEVLLGRAVSAMVAIGGAIWIADSDGRLELQYQINLQSTGLAQDEEGQARHSRLLYRALQESEGMLVAPHSGTEGEEEAANPTDYLLVLGSLASDRERRGVIEIFQRTGAGPVTQRGYLRFLLQLCDLASNYLTTHQLRSFEDRQMLWGQLEQFTKAVHQSLDPRRTAYTVVNEGRRLIECDRVSLALQQGRQCRIEAISHQDMIDKRSNVAVLLSRLATRVVATGEPMWYTGSTDDMAPQLEEAVHEYVDASHAKVVGVLPLTKPRDPDAPEEDDHKPDEVIGALIVERFDGTGIEARTHSRVEVVCDHASSALANSMEHDGIFLMPVWRTLGKMKWLVRARTLPKTLAVVGAIVALILALFLVPADFDLEADGELQPTDRQDVFVHEGGLVTDVLVEHGEAVTEGQTLVQISSLELEGRITNLTGLMNATAEQIASIRNDRASNALSEVDRRRMHGQLKELEKTHESYANQIALLAKKKKLLRVTSPMAGEVVTWQPHRRLFKRTVEPGQVLLRVADPNGPWELDLFVRDDRMGHIGQRHQELTAEGKKMGVTFILATDPATEFEGTVEEIQTSAEVREPFGNTVLVRVAIDRDQLASTQLRPGASVIANLHCGRRSLGYVWFHDLIAWVRTNILFRL